MANRQLAAETPAWRRHVHADGFGYGWLLALILLSLGFQMAAPDDGWARGVTISLQGLTLVAALEISGANRMLIRLSWILFFIAIAAPLGLLIGGGEIGDDTGRVIALLMVLLAPPAIVVGIVRQARASGGVTVRTMFGVLCIYLLIGAAFGFAYGALDALSGDPFFAEIRDADQSDYLYFSFTTMTTTGFGDLTAAGDVGRSFTITEALIGQIYLVTIVALIVSNLQTPRVSRR